MSVDGMILIKKIKNIITQDNYGDIYTIDCYGGTALHTSTSHLIDLMW